MSCQSVQEQISWLLDRQLADAERESVLAHVQSCSACSTQLRVLQNMRAALRSMNRQPLPAALAMQLRVLASHERLRRLAHASVSARLNYWCDRLELFFDNLMRPVALPMAGGLLSALLLFGMLVPSLSFRHNFRDDLQLVMASDPEGRLVLSQPADGAPTWLWKGDSPRLEPVSTTGYGDETVLELTIDDTGRVADYAVSHGQLTPEMQMIILFSRFTPATFQGKRTWGKTCVVFTHHRGAKG